MFNEQRTVIPNRFLGLVGFTSITIVMLCLGYSYKLLQELSTDTVNPMEICNKVNQLRAPEYLAHLALSVALVLRGWWLVGILNFPFIFYNFAQWYEGRYLLNGNKVFAILAQEMRVIKAKASFFMMVVIYWLWEWATWVPPEYVRSGQGYNVMKNIQVSH